MTKRSTRNPDKGIVRPVWDRPHARPDRIAVYKLTGFSAIVESVSAAFRTPPEPPALWKIDIGNSADVAPIDQGRTMAVQYFWEALELVDSIRRRAEGYQRSQRLEPGRIRPRLRLGPLPGSQVYVNEPRHGRPTRKL